MREKIPEEMREILKEGALEKKVRRAIIRQALENHALREEVRKHEEFDQDFHKILQKVKPASGEGLQVDGWEVYGREYPENGIAGGDHLIWTNFAKRYRMDFLIAEAERTGRRVTLHGEEYLLADKLRETKTKGVIYIADVQGHDFIAASQVPALHQLHLGLQAVDVEEYGTPTTRIFKIESTRFFNSTNITRTATAIHVEIRPDGQVKWVSMAHPLPVIYDVVNDIFANLKGYGTTFAPIGSQPSNDETMPEVAQGERIFNIPTSEDEVMKFKHVTPGDLLILYTDGIEDHKRGEGGAEESYFPRQMNEMLKRTKHLDVKSIHHAIIDDFRRFARPMDDYTLVIARYKGLD